MNDDRPHYEAELRADADTINLTNLEVFLGHVDDVDLWRCRVTSRIDAHAVIFCSPKYFGDALWFWTVDGDDDRPSRERFAPELPEDHPSHDIAEAHRLLHQ